MSIVPREIQEKIENQEEQIRMLNLKLKKTIQDSENIESKLKANRFGFWFFFLALLGFVAYTYFFAEKLNFGNGEDIEKLKRENEYLTVENKTTKSSLDDCLAKGSSSKNGNRFANYDGVIYRVQLGAFKKFRIRPYSENISSLLDEYSVELLKKYSIGLFDNKNDAEKLRRDLRRLGFRDCFITYEYKGNRISYKESLRIKKNNK